MRIATRLRDRNGTLETNGEIPIDREIELSQVLSILRLFKEHIPQMQWDARLEPDSVVNLAIRWPFPTERPDSRVVEDSLDFSELVGEDRDQVEASAYDTAFRVIVAMIVDAHLEQAKSMIHLRRADLKEVAVSMAFLRLFSGTLEKLNKPCMISMVILPTQVTPPNREGEIGIDFSVPIEGGSIGDAIHGEDFADPEDESCCLKECAVSICKRALEEIVAKVLGTPPSDESADDDESDDDYDDGLDNDEEA